MHNFVATNTLITHYMKSFLKIVLGTIVGLVIFSILSTFVFFGFIGTIASIGETKPIVYPSSVMTIDMSKIVLTEQTKELDVLSMMQGKSISEGHIMQGDKSKNEFRIHPTQKPVALYAWIFQNFARGGQKILDTHLGSGSSRIAAYRLGLDFYGCELDKGYFDASQERFDKECLGIEVFGNHTITQQTLF